MSDQSESKKSVDKSALLAEFMATHKMKLKPGIDFPQYKKAPVECELALAVLNKHDATIVFEIVDEESAESSEISASV